MGFSTRKAGLILLGTAIGAFAAVPALHLIDHHDDHVHVGGSIVYVGAHGEKDRRAPREEPAGGNPAPRVPENDGSRHGSGSLSHFAIGATLPVIAAAAPPVHCAMGPARKRPPDPPTCERRWTHRARAPPAAWFAIRRAAWMPTEP